jgi:N-acetylglucosaminyldiphosphoundecaprenol N-acetyl-beta-D-mannosaminyltransferase
VRLSSGIEILGVRVDPVTYESATERVLEAASAGDACTVTALAVHGLMEAVDAPDFRERLGTFDLVCPDGQPLRWVLNLRHGARLKDRVYGPELMRRLCREAAQRSVPIFLYGSDYDTLKTLSCKLKRDYPGIVIAGTQSSRFGRVSRDELAKIALAIQDSGAQMCFVGLGCPRQEVFTYEVSAHISFPVIAVGAAFRYLAGFDSEPPRWVQRAGLQWLHRLLRDPVRLWRRYLILNPRFVIGVVREALFGRKDGKGEERVPGFEGWA